MTTKSKTVQIKKSDKIVSVKERGNGNAKHADAKEVKQMDIATAKKVLEEQIAKFQQKAKLINNKELFEEKRNLLLEYMKEEGTDFDDSLDSHNLVLILGDNSRYNEDGRIKISNNLIINQMLKNVIVQMNNKITELEKDILS